MFICFPLILSSLSSCSNSEKRYIKFFNYDGTLLWQEEYKGQREIVYGGDTPTKPTDDIYEYTFSRWNRPLTDAGAYMNFYAIFDSEFRSFNVSFRNYDNTLLKTASVKYGQNAYSFAPDNPTKPSDGRIHYRFSHWDGEGLTYVTSDLSCTATYIGVECFEIRYNDYDGSLINIEYIEKGGKSDYTITNIRDADPDHLYVFAGWDKPVTDVQSDMVVTATYSLVNAYTVTFKNWNGTILGTEKVPIRSSAQYRGSTPTRPSEIVGDYIFSYSFTGWDKDLTYITRSFETVAQYKTDSYNYRYPEIIGEIKQYLREHGGYTDGTYSYVFSIDVSSGGYLYTGILQMDGYNGRLSIFMSLAGSDSSGTKATATRLYLDNYWNNGYFAFDYQNVTKDVNGNIIRNDLGNGSMYGPTFTSDQTLYFDYYSGTMSEVVAAYNCALMLSISLDKFARSSTWSMASLGFKNYDY